jgi:nucleoid DNA-binding protein
MAARKKTVTKAKGTTAKKKTAAKPAKAAKVAKPAKKTAKRKTATKAKHAVKRAVKRTAAHAKPKQSAKAISVGRKPYTKSQFIATICEHTGLARKEVVAVLETIPHIINAHVQKQGPEMFSWPGMFKILVIKKPATKARQGINPFTGESMLFKAKPASRRVKIRPLKQLKSMAA